MILKTHCKNGHARTPDNLNAKRACRICTKAYHQRYEKNRSPEAKKVRASTIRLNKHGVTESEFRSQLVMQDNKCAICRRDFTLLDKNTTPHIDHDHETGRNRELLCDWCNKALGNFQDNIISLERAIEYLRRHGKV